MKLLNLILIMCTAFILKAQCPDGYLIDAPYDFTSEDVYFGSNTNVLGDTIDLFMTLYTPSNDTFSERPVVIFAFGGAFVSGDRNDPIMTGLCEQFASKGYVAATIDYRLFPSAVLGNPDSIQLVDANVKAVGDMKAAIRFFRQSAAEGNPYKVNPDFILVGGYSAGAFTALHSTYIDDNDELPAFLDSLLMVNGGLEGSTGDADNRQYSSEVQGCISFSGALFNPEWINNGEPRLFLLHGSDDETVPVGQGRSVETVTTFGSDVLFERAQQESVDVQYTRLEGAGHIDYWFPLFYVQEKAAFFSALDATVREAYCPLISSDQHEIINNDFTLYPNPVSDRLFVELSSARELYDYRIVDMYGRSIQTGQINGRQEINGLGHLVSGYYVFLIEGVGTRLFFKQ